MRTVLGDRSRHFLEKKRREREREEEEDEEEERRKTHEKAGALRRDCSSPLGWTVAKMECAAVATERDDKDASRLEAVPREEAQRRLHNIATWLSSVLETGNYSQLKEMKVR